MLQKPIELLEGLLQKVRVVADELGGGIDLVSDASGQVPDRLQLLCLGKLALEQLAISNIRSQKEKSYAVPRDAEHGVNRNPEKAVFAIGTPEGHIIDTYRDACVATGRKTCKHRSPRNSSAGK